LNDRLSFLLILHLFYHLIRLLPNEFHKWHDHKTIRTIMPNSDLLSANKVSKSTVILPTYNLFGSHIGI